MITVKKILKFKDNSGKHLFFGQKTVVGIVIIALCFRKTHRFKQERAMTHSTRILLPRTLIVAIILYVPVLYR